MKQTKMNIVWRLRGKVTIIVLVIVAAIIGYLIGAASPSKKHAAHDESHSLMEQQAPQIWTCSMHPQIKLPKTGKCPICFMDLIPLQQHAATSGGVSDRRLVLSAAARQLASIATAVAIRRNALYELRMTGKVAVNESTVETISLRIGGRIDRLYVDYTGMSVRQGDHLAEMYSPDLISLQQELISANRAFSAMATGLSETTRANAGALISAAKEKLRLLGFTEVELTAILARGSPADHMTIRAAQSGVVLERMASAGSYVEAGMPLFKIADLKKVWVLLDAYESDIKWVRMGQKVGFTVEAYPGEIFSGTVSFIDPSVDPMTRTVKVRVQAENKDLRLKPEMFVRATVKASMTSTGKVAVKSLSGKWVCPMHPEMVKNDAGACDICGMPLVTAESLGLVTSGAGRLEPLLIPATAPLFTGERAIVYVEITSDSSETTYEGREVVLGARAGDYYIVKSGIAEGERVVVSGAFRIDSELQIHAQPSMMNPPQTSAPEGAAHRRADESSGGELQPGAAAVNPKLLRSIERFYDDYFALAHALTVDSLEQVGPLLGKLADTRAGLAAGTPKQEPLASITGELDRALSQRSSVEGIADARVIFEKVSKQAIALQKHYGSTTGNRYLAFCPMAFNNNGAYWLQKEQQIANPYFGASMLRCGAIKETFTRRTPGGGGEGDNGQ